MKEVKILDLPERQITDQDYALIVSPDGTHSKGLYGDIASITSEALLESGEVADILAQAQSAVDEAARNGASGKTATPTTLPVSGVQIYNVSVVGTYSNFGGVVVNAEDLSSGLVQLRLENNVWKKVITPIDSDVITSGELINNPITGGLDKGLSAEVGRAVSNLNLLSEAESEFSTGELGRWVASVGVPAFSIVSNKLRITFTTGNQNIHIPGIFLPGVTYTVKLKVKIVSGTPGKLNIGFFAGAGEGVNNIAFVPTLFETEYTGTITNPLTTPAGFSIGILAANNNGLVIEVDSVIFVPKMELERIISTLKIDTAKIAAVAPQKHIGAYPTGWVTNFGSLVPDTTTYPPDLFLNFSTGGQAVRVDGVVSSTGKYSFRFFAKTLAGTITLHVGTFYASSPDPLAVKTVVITPEKKEYVIDVNGSAGSTSAYIGVLTANNNGSDVVISNFGIFERGSDILANMVETAKINQYSLGDLPVKPNPSAWVSSVGALVADTTTYPPDLFLNFSSGNQEVHTPGVTQEGKDFIFQFRAKTLSGTITVNVGSFFASTLDQMYSKSVLITPTEKDYVVEIKGYTGSNSAYIYALTANNNGSDVIISGFSIFAKSSTIAGLLSAKTAPVTNRPFSANVGTPFASLSRTESKLVKVGVLGDSLMGNPLGGTIPGSLDEGDTMRPLRLTYNTIARRLYDLLSWNKPTFRRCDHAGWTKSGTWVQTTGGTVIFEPGYTNERYHTSIVASSYVEISVPNGMENFAFICQQKAGFSNLTVTLNGGSIAAYGPSSVTCNVANIGHTGNPYFTVEYLGLPAGVNTIRIARDGTTSMAAVWGGFWWTGNTLIVQNIAHGGHTMSMLQSQLHIAGELEQNNFDAVLFEMTIQNEMTTGAGNISTSVASLESLLINNLIKKDVVIMTCNPWGWGIVPIEGEVNRYTQFPGIEEMTAALVDVCMKYNLPIIDVFQVFKRKVENKGGTLLAGDAGLFYSTDSQHPNEVGVQQWWNIIEPVFKNTPLDENGLLP